MSSIALNMRCKWGDVMRGLFLLVKKKNMMGLVFLGVFFFFCFWVSMMEMRINDAWHKVFKRSV